MKNKIKNFTRGRKFQSRKNKTFNSLIIAQDEAKSQVSATKNLSPASLIDKGQEGRAKYKRIVDIFKHSGGQDEAEIYLICWGVPSPIKDLILAYAEYDVMSGGAV